MTLDLAIISWMEQQITNWSSWKFKNAVHLKTLLLGVVVPAHNPTTEILSSKQTTVSKTKAGSTGRVTA
jgi:hypothetical protein